MQERRILFPHSRCVHFLALLFLVAAELVGEGDAGDAVAGEVGTEALVCPCDGGGDGASLEEVLAVGGEDGTGVGEGVAEGEVEVARGREVHRALDGFAVDETIDGEGEVVATGEAEGGAGGCHAVGDVAVEGAGVVVAVLLSHPHADEVEASGEPPREVEGQGSEQSCLLMEVEVVELGNLVEAFGRLVHGLHEIVFLIGEPSAEDVFALQDVADAGAVGLRGFQQRIAKNFFIRTARVGGGVLHSPIVGIAFVAAEGELPDALGLGSEG